MKKIFGSGILIGAMALVLSGCGGGNSGASGTGTGGSGSGSGGSSSVSPNLSINVSGLTSGGSVTVQGTDNVSGKQVGQQSVTAASSGVSSFAQAFQTNDSIGGNAVVDLTITAQPTNGEQCILGSVNPQSVQSAGSWSFSPDPVPVYCSSPVKPTAYPQLGAFPGVSTAQVIASPKVVPVFLAGSVDENLDLTFLQQLVVSQYWGSLSEYAVGGGTVESALYPAAPAGFTGSVDDAEVRSAIQSNNAWGASLDPSTVLVVFLPSGVGYTAVTGQGEPYYAFGDHGQVTVNSVNVQFVVVETNLGGNEVREAAEYLVDAVTNPGGGGPNMTSSMGYVEMSPNPDAYAEQWNPQSTFGVVSHMGQEFVELGNACDGVAPPESDLTLSSGVSLPAIWSNSAASQAYASGNYGYCQAPYGEVINYSSSADAKTVTATRFGKTFTDQALVIPAGGSTTVTVTAWGQNSNGQNQTPWTLTAAPEIFYTSGTAAPADCSVGTPEYQSALVPPACANAPTVSMRPNGSTAVTNGDTFTVSITMPATGEAGLWSILLSGTDGGTQLPILVTNSTTWQ